MQDIKKQIIATQYASVDNLSARIRFHQRYNTNAEAWWWWVFRQVREVLGQGPKDILEVGCGRGDFWKNLRSNMPLEWKIWLTDASEAMVETIRSHNLSRIDSVERREAVEAFSGKADLDAVIANHMLYCLTDHDRKTFFSLVFKHLKQRRGVLCATTNGLRHLAEMWDLVFEFDPSLRPIVEASQTISSPIVFCKENGFEQLKSFFAQVEWRDYGSRYCVHDADLFCGFVCSFLPIKEALETKGQENNLRDFVDARIKRDGHIVVHSVSGMFVARP